MLQDPIFRLYFNAQRKQRVDEGVSNTTAKLTEENVLEKLSLYLISRLFTPALI